MYSGPVRICVSCRTRRPQAELLRVTAGHDGAVVIEGRRHRAPGRGAYVCNDPSCVERASKSSALRRALRRDDVDSSEVRRGLEDFMEEINNGRKQSGEAQSS
jgi:predicted RNA-binding protein YlxR (DUF448 family)